MAGTWNALNNLPPSGVSTTLLLTDGTMIGQGSSANTWQKLTPDSNGSYANGSWSSIANSINAPLYYASGVLNDGRVIVCGGEYNNGALVWLVAAEMYNPVSDTWTALPTPAGWARIGDAPGCVLPDGRFFLGEVGAFNTAIYDPNTNTWTAAANKIALVGEESWSLLPDGTIHAVDCSNPPNAEKYIIASDEWVNAGATPQSLVDGISEIGASVLLQDGRLFVIGATGFTAIYTFPTVADQPGTWAAGPNIPDDAGGGAQGAVDAPAVVLPNGKILFSVGPITVPASFQAPTNFYEFDPDTDTIAAVPNPSTSGTVPYLGRLMMLPSGQALYSNGTSQVEIYTPDGTFDPVWRPTIKPCPGNLQPGQTFTLSGRQLNGQTQCVYYGNDATQATNYPIVRLESTSSPAVVYCRTFSFSTMGLQTGTVIHNCRFTVPASTPLGSYRLVVIANGIPSEGCPITVSNKLFKELKFEIKEKIEIREKFQIKEKVEIKEKIEINEKLQQKDKAEIKEFKEIKERVEFNKEDEKLMREDIDIGRFDEIDQNDWMDTIRTWAKQVDEVNEQLGRAFIRPEERPDVGIKEKKFTPVSPRKISMTEAKKSRVKLAYSDGRKELALSKRALKIHEEVHSISSRISENVRKTGTKSTKKKTRRSRKR